VAALAVAIVSISLTADDKILIGPLTSNAEPWLVTVCWQCLGWA